MKKETRNLIITGVVTVIVLLALGGYLIYRAPIRLAKRYPDLQRTSYTGYLQWGEEHSVTDMQIPNEELEGILTENKVHRTGRQSEVPETCFCFRTEGEPCYAITVGKDGSITVETGSGGKSSFWLDDGTLFAELYMRHIIHGGKMATP